MCIIFICGQTHSCNFTAPLIDAVTPNRGLPFGGELVTISGINMGTGLDVTSVLFCDTNATVVYQSFSQVHIPAVLFVLVDSMDLG